MKKFAILILVVLSFMGATELRAESIREIFEKISADAPEGNGSGHSVESRDPKKFSTKKELRKLRWEMNSDESDCKYGVFSGIKSGIQEIRTSWDDASTSARLGGLAKKRLIRAIIYSEWDTSTGDSEYCTKATIKVFAVDGTVLVLNYDETD